MTRNPALPLLVLVLFASAGCGPADEETFSPGTSHDFEADVGQGERIPIGEIFPPEGDPSFALISARVPAGATIIPLQAKLVSHADPTTTYTVSSTSVDRDGTWEGTPVEPGTYTLTWLDEQGKATPFSRQVQVHDQRATYIVVGGVRVHPDSAAFPEATTTVALEYRIADTENTLKTVRAELNHVIHLPAAPWLWFGVPEQGAELKPLQLDAGEDVLHVGWGSIYLSSNIQARLRDQSEASLLYSEMGVGVEHLLPVSSQVEGCYTYRIITGPEHQPSRQSVLLCSDDRRHFER